MNVALSAAVFVILVQGRSVPGSPWSLEHATLSSGATVTPTCVQLLNGLAYRPDLSFADGTIEFDLQPPGGLFAGVAFRIATAADYEMIYFIRSDDGDRWKTVEYQPVFAGETTWQLYYEDTYHRPIPKEMGRSLHVRITVVADRADVFLNGEITPTLRVRELKRDRVAGALGFWSVSSDGEPGNEIRNLHVDTTHFPSVAERLATIPSDRQLMRWRVSDRRMPPDGVHAPRTLPAGLDPTRWPIVGAESTGLVNLTKAIGNPSGRPHANVGDAGWGLAYAAVTIDSQTERTVSLSISYSDGIGVYLNGRRLYAGDNSGDSRYPGYLGVVGNEAETIDLPLRAGRNELVLAVTDKAFGWGFRAKLDSLDGLTIVP